jgi:uncharacterized SAM-binding protein YcdF (DUF218 family)
MRRKAKFAYYTIIASVSILYLSSITLISDPLLNAISTSRALDPLTIKQNRAGAQAIVVLGGGRYANPPEYDSDRLSSKTHRRVLYASWLSKEMNLPIIAVGGVPDVSRVPESILIKQFLEEKLGHKDIATEDKSLNTYENAKNLAPILKRMNIQKVYLVTHAWHTRRAVRAFREMKIDVVAAPTGFATNLERGLHWKDIIPRQKGLSRTYIFLHEFVGYLWYDIKYY